MVANVVVRSPRNIFAIGPAKRLRPERSRPARAYVLPAPVPPSQFHRALTEQDADSSVAPNAIAARLTYQSVLELRAWAADRVAPGL